MPKSSKQKTKQNTESLLRFLDASPTPFHAVANVIARLHDAGYVALREADEWGESLSPGKYYLTRNDSSIIAVNLTQPPATNGFRLVGGHTDSPCLKVKPQAITVADGYAKLGVEVYGGALLSPWFDRDLGLAGRVTLRTAGGIENRLINIDRAIAFIPSLAIHLDRDANDNRSINRQKELPAVLCRVADDKTKKHQTDFNNLLKTELKREQPRRQVGEILAHELSLYDCQNAAVVGLHNEFIASARLDNLLSCYAGTEALLAASGDANGVLVLNDHEEVGSGSASGADGPFLHSVLSRICGDESTFARALSRSMFVSADNAHGVHPNYADKHEPAHRPLINGGPAVKVNSNQRYATNSETAALFRRLCDRAGLPHQTIVVRSDMACGSTIGPITAAKLGVRTVDIGVPQLGMHSIRELAGVADQTILVGALTAFFDVKKLPV